MDDEKNKIIEKPECCEICGKRTRLSWHAKYHRTIISLCGTYVIPIKRLYCNSCKHTFALIPEFIEKFKHYGRDIIKFVINKLKSGKHAIEEVAGELEQLLPVEISDKFSILTIYNWKKQYC